MTQELILVLSSGGVGLILGMGLILFLRRHPGRGRPWEADSGRPTKTFTDRHTSSPDTQNNRFDLGEGLQDDAYGDTEPQATSHNRAPVAMLTAKEGEHQGRTWLLRQSSSTTIGRFNDCDIAINDNGVSRLHAQITHRLESATPHEFTIFDYSSTNGTMVNSEPINAVASLQDGDEIQIGNTTFLFQRVRS